MRRIGSGVVALAAVLVAGCMMIGPDYRPPAAPMAEAWLSHDGVAPDSQPIGPWWESFGDPVLTNLIVEAYRQNPTLQAAGVRVIQAQARRGIAIGALFPQTQNLTGGYTRVITSENSPVPTPERTFNDFSAGLDVGWEIDFWGKFRRGIESADAELLASVANYDDVLVSLLAEVATNYIGIRTSQAELQVARRNADIQRKSYGIAKQRAQQGAVTDVDPQQAATLLYGTEAQIPTFQSEIEQQAATLSALLGVPPKRVEELVGADAAPIPTPPEQVAIGVPADLLRRRPDVRREERLLAAQSAQIGVAKADLLPHLSLIGSVGLDAERAAKFFAGESFTAFGGPSVSWAIFNYGRITNNVRVQDAAYQALVNEYTATVLGAQADVEAALAVSRGAQDRTAALVKSVRAAQKVVDLTGQQYAEGSVDFTTVLLAQQLLVQQEDLLVGSRGQVAVAMVTIYKSIGGGWEPYAGNSVVSDENAAQMAARTQWGDLLAQHRQQSAQQAAGSGTEQDQHWWRWRWWRPQW